MPLMPEAAPAVALALLAAAAIGGGGAVLFVGLLLADRPQAALRVVGAVVVAGVLYVAGLGWASVSSTERVLEAGEYKYFCELDCHFAVTLVDVEWVDGLGAGGDRVEAEGRFAVVRVRAWFDESTVTSRRGRGMPLYTAPRRVRLVDGSGGSWAVSAAGQRALGEPLDALDRSLKPGESYEARYVFDVPADAVELRLLVEDRSLVSRFMIGHENSPLHGKIGFRAGGPQ
jgi:hypothetical protein